MSQDVPPSFHRPQSRLGYEERPQSRVGYTSDSRCASGLGYDDTGGGYLDQTDPRMYCTSGYCMGDTMMAASRGVCGEEVELDMRRHIQACACTCNHMGYGNYMDYQVNCPTNFQLVSFLWVLIGAIMTHGGHCMWIVKSRKIILRILFAIVVECWMNWLFVIIIN